MTTIAALLAALIVPVAVVPGVAAADPSAFFYIVAVHSGKCLTVHQDNRGNNGRITQYECVDQRNQQFQTIDGRTWAFKQIRARNSRLCLTVYQAKTTAGAPINQYDCNNGWNQNFITNNDGSGKPIMVIHSEMCINIKGASRKDNAEVIQWPCVDAPNGRFRLEEV